MTPLYTVLLYATLAGVTIPLGAVIARIENIRPRWLETEFRHGVIAFGGGVLLAAMEQALGSIMLFTVGGILYRTFEDIAPTHTSGVTGRHRLAPLPDSCWDSSATR